MELQIAQRVYEMKYRDIKLEQYLTFLKNGIELLKANALKSSDCTARQLVEMNMALEYNMELMLQHLRS